VQEKNYSIKKWAKDDRPREKLRSRGPQQLSDSELLAILLREGTRQKTAVDLARDLLRLGRDDLDELGRLQVGDFMKVHGIGEARAITIAAALELGRRRQCYIPPIKPIVKGSKQIAEFIRSRLRDHQHEVFGVVFLNRANRIRHHEVISMGGITGTVADPRVIFKKALSEDAVSLILFHNHPSGSLQPSQADEELTERLVSAGKLLDIRILDHIIVSGEGYFSFADEGLI
jgi:DNA repair protein RadC